MILSGRILTTTILAAATFASSAPAQTVSTSTQAIPVSKLLGAVDLGPVSASLPMTIRLGLQMQNKAALVSYVKAINDPHNALYGQRLTAAQFTATYAPSAAQAAAVASFLSNAGFSNVKVEPNRMIVSADGTAALVAATFKTPLENFSQFGKVVFGNLAAPQVPASLGSIVGAVLGLNTIGNWKTNLALPSVGVNYLQSFTPAQFNAVYDGFGAPLGSNTSIAIMAEGDMTGVISDLRVAEAQFGLPQVPVEVRQVGLPSADVSGADEWDMDTQYSTGMAGNVKQLYIYTTSSLSDSDLALEISRWVTDNVAPAASASLGICEFFPFLDGSMLVDDNSFLQGAAQGQTFFASSGDTGSFCPVSAVGVNGVPAGAPVAQYPASSTYVIGVGGTSLLTNDAGGYASEISWYAGGGGISQFEGPAFWQKSASTLISTTGSRGVPDVAYDADPNSGANVVVNGVVEGVGGTSLSSPMMLGTWARVLSANPRIGHAGPALYSLYDGTGLLGAYPKGGFHDVTIGANGLYPATPGYDLNTGLGTPDITQLINALKQ